MPAPRILVLGGYGLIGSAVVERLLAAGHPVTGLGRSVAGARRSLPGAAWVERDMARLRTSEDWLPLLDGIGAVVNCAGALQDGPRDDVRAVQSVAARALFAACARAGVRRVVQVSAAGADPGAATAFLRTKAEADAALARLDLDWVVLRPGLVLAPQAYGGTALLRALASLPLALPPALASRPVQTVHVDEVARAVLLAVEGRVPARAAYDLVEAEARPLAEVVAAWRARLGCPRARGLPVPLPLVRAAFRAGDALSLLGWRPPARTTALRTLQPGVVGDPGPWARASGRPVPGLEESLRRLPSTVQERWFGRTWALKPLVIGTLAAFWAGTGLVALWRLDEAAALLTDRGFGERAAALTVAAGATLDLALGVAVAFRRATPWAALGMAAATSAYLLGGTALAPELWADPLGPYLKSLPGAVLALVAWAIAEER